MFFWIDNLVSPGSLCFVRTTPGATYRGTSLTRKRAPPGPYSRTVPRALWWSWEGGGSFLCAMDPCTKSVPVTRCHPCLSRQVTHITPLSLTHTRSLTLTFTRSHTLKATNQQAYSPAPYTLHLVPCTLYPAPCTLHPAPCTLHPAPYTSLAHSLSVPAADGVPGAGRRQPPLSHTHSLLHTQAHSFSLTLSLTLTPTPTLALTLTLSRSLSLCPGS